MNPVDFCPKVCVGIDSCRPSREHMIVRQTNEMSAGGIVIPRQSHSHDGSEFPVFQVIKVGSPKVSGFDGRELPTDGIDPGDFVLADPMLLSEFQADSKTYYVGPLSAAKVIISREPAGRNGIEKEAHH